MNLKFNSRTGSTQIAVRCLLVVLFVVVGQFVQAQVNESTIRSEVSIYVNGPFSKLSYGNANIKTSINDGIGFGVNYGLYLTDYITLRSGIEYQYFKGNATFTQMQGNYDAIDPDGERFEFRYNLLDYQEKQNVSYVQVPLLIQYESRGPKTTHFYIAGGIKLGFNVSADYQAEADNLLTSGYYAQYDALLDAPRFIGFGNFGNYKTNKEDLKLRTNYIASFETGIKINSKKKNAIYIGLFIDFGLKNLIDEQMGANTVQYQPSNPSAFSSNSVITSTQSGAANYLNELRTLSFGYKIRYGFGL